MKNLILTTCLICLSTFISQAQDTTLTKQDNQQQESLFIEIKDGSYPDIYIDGKKYDRDILDLINPDRIESISVIKDEQAIKEYNAPDGVIVIKTKEKKQEEKTNIYIKGENKEKDPIVIIDGKISDKETLSKISSNEIKSIDVLKGKVAEEKYNTLNGAIIVTTKQNKKK